MFEFKAAGLGTNGGNLSVASRLFLSQLCFMSDSRKEQRRSLLLPFMPRSLVFLQLCKMSFIVFRKLGLVCPIDAAILESSAHARAVSPRDIKIMKFIRCGQRLSCKSAIRRIKLREIDAP